MKEDGLIYKTLPQIFYFLPRDLVITFKSEAIFFTPFFDFEKP